MSNEREKNANILVLLFDITSVYTKLLVSNSTKMGKLLNLFNQITHISVTLYYFIDN